MVGPAHNAIDVAKQIGKGLAQPGRYSLIEGKTTLENLLDALLKDSTESR